MKTGKSFILALSFCMAAPSMAGMPVTDPVSYTYYVQQLKQMINTYNTNVDQLTQMNEINGQVRSMEGQLKGQYNRANGLINELNRAKEITTGVPGTMSATARSYARNAESLKDTAENPFEDARVSLDALFIDPRSGPLHKTDLDRQYYARQSAVRDSIVTADGILKQIPESFANIDSLANKIDSTQNVKDAQDLTNRLLVEVLKTLTQLLIVDARLTQASGLINYKGVSEEATEQRLTELDKAAKSLHKEGLIEELERKYSGSFDGNFYKIINKLNN